MNNYSKIYWLTRLDSIQGALIVLFTIIVIAFIIYFIGRGTSIDYDTEDYDAKFGKFRKPAFIVAMISLLIITFLPSKNDMILIYAGGKTMDFVQKDSSINKIPAQTTKIISDYLDKTIKEMDKTK